MIEKIFLDIFFYFLLFRKGIQLACQDCPLGFTTAKVASTQVSQCSLPICTPGQYLNATLNACTPCPRGYYQDESQQTECKQCPPDTSTKAEGADDPTLCTNRYASHCAIIH